MNKTKLVAIALFFPLVVFSQNEDFEINFRTTVYESILNNLEKNYTKLRQDLGDEFFFEYYPISEDYYLLERNIYDQTLQEIPMLNKNFIIYLLKFETIDSESCNWIYTRNPHSSFIKKYDIITKSKAALILIDNYLRPDLIKNKLEISSYIESLSFFELKSFLKENLHLGINDLRENYKLFVSTK